MFLIVAALRINWAGVICDRVALSKFLEAVSTSAAAYHEDDGKPCLHKFLSDSSAKCPSTHEVWKWLLMERYSYMDML